MNKRWLYKRALVLLVLLSFSLLSSFAAAHKLAPSLLRLTEQVVTNDQADVEINVQAEVQPEVPPEVPPIVPPTIVPTVPTAAPNTAPLYQFQVYWKTPAKTQGGQRLQPQLPASCQLATEPAMSREATALVWQWLIRCSDSLPGQSVQVAGMAETATATLVKIEWLNGNRVQQLLTAESPQFTIPADQGTLAVVWEYTRLGTTHIALGIDHLLFVLALLLLVPNRRALVWTITAFTIGHSITLSLVALGYLNYPVSLVELAIAASIFVLAVELSKLQPKLQTELQTEVAVSRWIPSHSWVVAVGFGLLHGMGFAGALSEIGLPYADIPLALLSFNIGIEIGQLLFILLALMVTAVGRRCLPGLVKPSGWLATYAIGSLAAFWCIERGIAAVLGG